MKVAYVAGKYRSKTEWGLIQNIRKAEEIAAELWSYGYAVICPHKNTAHFGGVHNLNDQIWLDGDLEILKRCDLVVATEEWQDSEGAREEIKTARQYGIPVYFWPEYKEILKNYNKTEKTNEQNE